MASRYNLRKRKGQLTMSEDYNFDLELMLADHEQTGVAFRKKREAKKPRSAGTKSPEWVAEVDWSQLPPIPLDSLPALCIERVYSMLDSPQDLYNLSHLNKHLMSLVTPDVVIRSAVFNNLRKRDVQIRKLIASIMNYLSNRSIHVPSAHRLLRLLNAKTCERGSECWGRDLLSGRPGELDPTACCRPFGLAVCERCVKFASTNFPYSHYSRFQRGVAFHQWNKAMDPLVDAVTGETHGPLVKAIQLQQIESSYKTSHDRKDALQIIVGRAQEESGRRRGTGTAAVARAAGSDAGVEADGGDGDGAVTYEERAAALVEVFEKAENEADDFVEEANRKEYEKYQKRREDRIARRVQRSRYIFGALEDLLSDYEWKDIALNCTWNEDDQDCLKFNCTLVDEVMKGIVRAPASASDKMITDAAARIREVFTILNDKDFFTYSFIADSSNRFRQGMHEYCLNKLTRMEVLSSPYADMSFLRQVEANQPTRALIRVLKMIRGALPCCFALSVVRPSGESNDDRNGSGNDEGNNHAEDQDERIEDYRKLAEVVWKKKSSIGPVWSLASVKASYNACQEEFRTMKGAVKAYLSSPETRAFLRREPPDEDADPDRRRGNGEFTRRDALNQVFSPSTSSSFFMTLNERVNPYELLLSRNFQTLRDVHEAYHRWPQRYGFSDDNDN